jgi:Holliday junction resolvase RusA-like endonuclease
VSNPETLDFDDGVIRFFVPGIPAPGGSKRFVGIGRKTGRAILIDAAGEKNKNWRAAVAQVGARFFTAPLHGPLCVGFVFFMPRPKGHFGTGKKAGVLKPGAPAWHTTKPDLLKLMRSTEDALTGIAWVDDSQTCVMDRPIKQYGDQPGCLVTIRKL